MNAHVLDASAVLAWLWQEEGSAQVEELLTAGACLLSSVNLAEIASKALDKGLPRDRLGELLSSLDAEIVPYGLEDALETALLRPLTRNAGLSLGDRACLALAKTRGATAVTADRAWLRIDPDLGIAVECIRGKNQ